MATVAFKSRARSSATREEVDSIRARAAEVDHICAEVGAVLVAWKSDEGRGVSARWANTKECQALSNSADNSHHGSS